MDKARSNPAGSRHRLWLLMLVPARAGGRWLCAAGIFLVLSTAFWFAGALSSPESGPAALFFCAILSYITPIFHYVTERCEASFDELVDSLALDQATIAKFRQGLSCKSTAWLLVNTSMGILAWLMHSLLLSGGLAQMIAALYASRVDFVMAVGPLPVWVFMFAAIHSLVDNARTFRKLTDSVQLDLLDTWSLTPFGRMAVASTLVVIGAQALFPIMLLGEDTSPWASIPGLVVTTLPLLYLFFAPVWPLHKRLRSTKREQLARLAAEIRSLRESRETPPGDPALSALLVYRREIAEAAEWPFDVSIVARFGLYLVIVPLTWIGAALIENLVDLFIST